MGTSSFAALTGMGLFAMLVMCMVGILLAALVLSVAFRLALGYMPSYLRALGAVLLTAVTVVVVSIILRMILPGGLSGLLSLVAQFLVGAAVVNYLLLARDGSQIGYGKACMVQLLYLVIGIVLALIIGFIFSLVFGAAMLGMH